MLLISITCRWCDFSFFLCRSCWRGHAYCCDACRTAGKLQNRREAQRRYRQTEKGKERNKRYYQTENGKAANAKHNSKRNSLDFIPLNEHFEGGEWHHIDEIHVVCIPKELHRSIWHNVRTGEGMEEMNDIAFKYATEDIFVKLIAGEI